MASQISHIIYAKKYLDELESGKFDHPATLENKFFSTPLRFDRDEFILGAVFPDIRRIDKNIRRQDTHHAFHPISLDFANLSSFEAGWKFHLYCDMKREEILNDLNYYSLSSSTNFHNLPGKFVEDQLLYDKYNNWEKLYHYFNHPPRIIADFKLNRGSVELWYAIVAKYISETPTERTIRIFISKQPTIQKYSDEIIIHCNNLLKNKKAVSALLQVQEKII